MSILMGILTAILISTIVIIIYSCFRICQLINELNDLYERKQQLELMSKKELNDFCIKHKIINKEDIMRL